MKYKPSGFDSEGLLFNDNLRAVRLRLFHYLFRLMSCFLDVDAGHDR